MYNIRVKILIMVNKTIPVFVIAILVLGFILLPSVFASNEKKEDKELKIPAGATEIAPGVLSLGKAKDVNGKEVEGIMFVHYKKEFAKPQGVGNGPNKNTCYSFLTKRGVEWKTLEPWVANPANSRGLTGSFILSNIGANIQKWEDASNGIVGDTISTEIMGDGSLTSDTLVADSSSPDGVNEIYFANISSTGVIAVTTVWYNTFLGQIVEWDQVYDDADFNWSSSTDGVAGSMDFENISTHEIGHAVGMGHPSDSCSDETMYRYADFAETKKRDLNTGDIAGINALY